jgi:hypothetical protein
MPVRHLGRPWLTAPPLVDERIMSVSPGRFVMESRPERLPRVSLHSLPPYANHCPLPYLYYCPFPAIGYLRGYLEKHRPGISVTCAYWHQAISKMVLRWLDERTVRGGAGSYEELLPAVFARLYFLEAEEPADAGAVEFLQKYGSIFLDAQPLEGFAALCDRISSFLRAEEQRLRLDTMDIIGASVMTGQLIPALAFLRGAKRRFRTPLTVLTDFPTVKDARQILTAFPCVDVGIFGDGEQTLLAICDARQDPAALEGLAGTVVRRGDRLIENRPRGYVNAPELAFANYEGFDWTADPSEGPLGLPIWNARGCPWGKCTFCILRDRPPEDATARCPESILAEVRQHMSSIRKTSAVPIQVQFLGNEVNGRGQGPPMIAELLRGLLQLREEFGSLSVFGELSPVDLTDEVACLLNRLNGTVQLGFEQWSRVVQLAHKRHRIIDGVYALKLFERYPNLHLAGFNLLVGFPGETLSDVYETKSNLWRLKYLLAPLAARNGPGSPQGGLLLVKPRTLRMMQVPIAPELVKRWDFNNPFVRENAAHRPCTVLLGMMCGDERLAADYVLRNEYFETYDTTATDGLQRRLVTRFEKILEECSIRACRTPDGLLELELYDGANRLAVPLEPTLLRLLHETRDIVSRARLAERLADIPGDEVEEAIEFLDTAELLYVSRRGHRVINTLPAPIQAEVDLAALQLHREDGPGLEGSGTALRSDRVVMASGGGAAQDMDPASCR